MKRVVFVLMVLATGFLHQIVTAYTWKVTNNIDVGNPNVDGGYGFRLRIGADGPAGTDITRVVSKGDTNDFNAPFGFWGSCLIHVDYQRVIGDNSTWQRVPYVGGAGNFCGNGHIVVARKNGRVAWNFAGVGWQLPTGYTMTITSAIDKNIDIRVNFSSDHRTSPLDAGSTVRLTGGVGLCLTNIEYKEKNEIDWKPVLSSEQGRLALGSMITVGALAMAELCQDRTIQIYEKTVEEPAFLKRTGKKIKKLYWKFE